MNYVFIVGADDPEMQIIRSVVKDNGFDVIQAYAEGKPVKAGNAYSCDEFKPSHIPEGRVVWVECGPHDHKIVRDIIVDHHNEGDPGYEHGPAEYWNGSSIGQVCNLIGVEPTDYLRLAAAADHCLGAAYRGECPGITPEALKSWRVTWRANRRGLKRYQLIARIEKATDALLKLPILEFQGHQFVDGMNQSIPELVEAAAIHGKALLITCTNRASQRDKVGLLGATPEAVSAWIAMIGNHPNFENIYGCPARGYAGAYYKQTQQINHHMANKEQLTQQVVRDHSHSN